MKINVLIVADYASAIIMGSCVFFGALLWIDDLCLKAVVRRNQGGYPHPMWWLDTPGMSIVALIWSWRES